MKTSVIFLFCLMLTVIAIGQNEKKDRVESISEIKVTPPSFTGVENVMKIKNDEKASSFNQYLVKNFIYPDEKIDYGSGGTEVVQFTVNTTGELSNFNIINSVSSNIDEEMIRVLKTTNGMWKPGNNNGKMVAMEKEVAIAIKIGETEYFALMKDFKTIAKACFKNANSQLLVRGKSQKALNHYNRGVRFMPYDHGLLLMRGLCKYELGDKEGARKDWDRLKALGGVDISDYFAEEVAELKGYNELIAMLPQVEN